MGFRLISQTQISGLKGFRDEVTFVKPILQNFYKIKEILSFVDLELNDKEVEKVDELGSLENMNTAEQNNRFKIGWLRPLDKKNKNSNKVRSGGKDKLNQYFSRSDLEYMKEIYSQSPTLKMLNYC